MESRSQILVTLLYCNFWGFKILVEFLCCNFTCFNVDTNKQLIKNSYSFSKVKQCFFIKAAMKVMKFR